MKGTTYCETTIRQRAKDIGFEVKKGYVRQISDGAIVTDMWGRKEKGFALVDSETGEYVADCANDDYCFLWTSWGEVEQFLRDEYRARGLEF